MNKNNQVKIVTFTPLALYADLDNKSEKYATLTWSIRLGFPRVTVYTENNRSKNEEFSYERLITAPMNAVMVNLFIDKLNALIANPKPDKFSIKCYNIKFVNGERTKDIELQATIVCWRDKNDIINLAAVADGKSKIAFPLMVDTKWHKITDVKGEEVTDCRTLSNMYAKAYSDRLKSLMDKHLADDAKIKYIDPKAKLAKTENLDIL
jgi:hypothetical protein